MSSHNKVLWKEGLFLLPHHFQQNDRYHERLVEARVRHTSPYPWGFSTLEIDRDLLGQGKFHLRRASGIMPDGTPFDFPADSPAPAPVDIPDTAADQMVWLTLPMASPNTREVDDPHSDGASRYVASTEPFIDTTAQREKEEEIGLALPRLALELRKATKPGFTCLRIALVREVRVKAVVLEDQYVPPALICDAHPTIDGWIDRVLGWLKGKTDQLAGYVSDRSAGGGLTNADYLTLQILNRHSPLLRHLRRSHYVHPERLYGQLLQLAGELATFTENQIAPEYDAYDHDNLASTFEPVLRDIQAFLSRGPDRRAIRLELIERAPNAFVSMIRDRSLFSSANLVLEVEARRPLTEIQSQFPNLLKVGPNTRMNQVVLGQLPSISLIHLPTPPPQMRTMADRVYFLLDRKSDLWPEFSSAASIGLHLAGEWPELQLSLWAVLGDRR